VGTSRKLQEEIARTEEQLRRRSALLNELRTSVGGNVDGFSAYLTALARQSTQGVWLTGVEISGTSNDLVIKGKALDANLVPAYVRALSREPVFSGRSLSALQVTARERPAQAAAGAAPAPREPSRYLEFTLNIPLGDLAARPAGERKSS
jgi:Tfp pilus assembly protein PilN